MGRRTKPPPADKALDESPVELNCLSPLVGGMAHPGSDNSRLAGIEGTISAVFIHQSESMASAMATVSTTCR
jgi:hypothetical protein